MWESVLQKLYNEQWMSFCLYLMISNTNELFDHQTFTQVILPAAEKFKDSKQFLFWSKSRQIFPTKYNQQNYWKYGS